MEDGGHLHRRHRPVSRTGGILRRRAVLCTPVWTVLGVRADILSQADKLISFAEDKLLVVLPFDYTLSESNLVAYGFRRRI